MPYPMLRPPVGTMPMPVGNIGLPGGINQPGIAERFRRHPRAATGDFNQQMLAIQLAQQQQAQQQQMELAKIAASGAVDRTLQSDRLLAADVAQRNELQFRGMDADADRAQRMAMARAELGFRGEQAALERGHDVTLLGVQNDFMQQRSTLDFYQRQDAENQQWMATMAQQQGLMNPEAAKRWQTTRGQLAKIDEMRKQLAPEEYLQARSQVFDEAKGYDWSNNMESPVKRMGMFDWMVMPDGKGGQSFTRLGLSEKATPEELSAWAQKQFVQVPGVGWMQLSPDGGKATFYPESRIGNQTPFDFSKAYEMGVKMLTGQNVNPETGMSETVLPTHGQVMDWVQNWRDTQERISRGEPVWSVTDALREEYRNRWGQWKEMWDTNRANSLANSGVDMGPFTRPRADMMTDEELHANAAQLGFGNVPMPAGRGRKQPSPAGGPPAGQQMPPVGPPTQQPTGGPPSRFGGTAGPGSAPSRFAEQPAYLNDPQVRQAPPMQQPPGVPFNPLMPGLNVPPELQTMRPPQAPPMQQPPMQRGPIGPPVDPRLQRSTVTMPNVEAVQRAREQLREQREAPTLMRQEPSMNRIPSRVSEQFPIATPEEAEAKGLKAFTTPDGILMLDWDAATPAERASWRRMGLQP